MKQKSKFGKLLSLSLALSMMLPSFVMPAAATEAKKDSQTVAPIAEEVESDRVVDTTSSDQEKTISILATADLHGRIYAYDYAVDEKDESSGLAKIQTIIKQEKAKNPNTILVDAGDTLQDNSAELFNDLPMHPMIQALNTMGFDAWTLGNHEFNFGKSFLDRNIEAFDGDVLAANIYNEDGSHYVKPYTIIEKDGVRVALIGLVAPHIPRWEASNPDHYKGLVFNKVVPEVQKAVKELEGQYDILAGVFHLGMDGEYGDLGVGEIAEACPELDVIFGGHAHAKFDDKEVNGVKIIEPGSYGKSLATADIKVVKKDDKWEVSNITTKNIDTKEITQDEDMLAEFAFVHKNSVMYANQVIGTITEDFITGVDYITGADKVTTMPTSQIEDTSLIDFINEVQLFYTGADISSAAAFKDDMNLKAGDFKRKDVANIYKHANTLMGINMTGKNLKEYMEWSASFYNTYKEGDVTVSFDQNIRGYNYDMFAGMTYDIDISEDAGNRIKNILIDGKALDESKVYKVAVNNYRYGTLEGLGLATAEDRYYDSYDEMQDEGRIRDLIAKYVVEQKNGVVTPECDNNWKIIGADLDNPLKDKVYEMIKNGEITIPTSEDGRTSNVKAVNVNELKAAGKLK